MAEAQEKDIASEQAWDAAQYEAALAHLERLQDQLSGVRMAIPTLVAPLREPATSKAKLFASIKGAATQATDDVRVFRENWTSEQTQDLLARSKKSHEQNRDLSKSRQVPRWGWSDEPEDEPDESQLWKL